MTENSSTDIGALLKAQRERLGFSLQNVAEATRIRKTYLESIESNRFEDLPGKDYVTGFIRVYARHLNLDSDPLLLLIDENHANGESSAEKLAPPGVNHRKSLDHSFSGKGLGVFVLVFAAVLVVGALIYFAPALFQSKAPAVIEPAPVPSTAPVPPANIEAPDEVTETVAQEIQTADQEVQATVQDADTAAQETKAENQLSPTAEPGSSTLVTEAPEARSLPAILAGGSTLRLLALGEGSLVVHVDDRKPHEYKLFNGLDLTWKVHKKVVVEMAQSDAVRCWLDAKQLELGGLSSFQLQAVSGE